MTSWAVGRLHHIVVVEDDPMFMELLLRWLRELGAEMTTTQTLQDAVPAVAKTRPAVIVLDLSLPDARELDALPAILQACEHRSAVVVITGREDVSRQSVRALGADAFLHKRGEITGEMIRAVVLEAFALKQQQLAHAQGLQTSDD